MKDLKTPSPLPSPARGEGWGEGECLPFLLLERSGVSGLQILHPPLYPLPSREGKRENCFLGAEGESIQLLRSGIRVSGTGCNINKNGHREGEARGDLRFPSFLYPEAELPESVSQTKIATPRPLRDRSDLWLVVCAGDGLSSELATSH